MYKEIKYMYSVFGNILKKKIKILINYFIFFILYFFFFVLKIFDFIIKYIF